LASNNKKKTDAQEEVETKQHKGNSQIAIMPGQCCPILFVFPWARQILKEIARIPAERGI